MASITDLANLLQTKPAGALEGDQTPVVQLLTKCWDQFKGSSAHQMAARKIDRKPVEQLQWNPPCLSFVIERHGGAARGSRMAELQRWEIDVNAKTARAQFMGFRALRPAAPRLDVRSLAQKIQQAVQIGPEGSPSNFIRWNGNIEVGIKPSILIPAIGPQRTVTERRKRLASNVIEKLQSIGWMFVEREGGVYVFRRENSL